MVRDGGLIEIINIFNEVTECGKLLEYFEPEDAA